MTDNQQNQPLSATNEPATATKHPFWRRGWFLGVVGLVLGIAIGSASAGGTDTTPGAAPAPTVTATVEIEVEGQPEPAETVTVDPAAEIQAEMDALAAELEARAAALDAREVAISGEEAAIEAGTFPGNGVFIVGTDIQPGTYRAEGAGRPCYWARLAAPDDILDNNLGEGQQIAVIEAGDALFETSGCTDWTIVP